MMSTPAALARRSRRFGAPTIFSSVVLRCGRAEEDGELAWVDRQGHPQGGDRHRPLP
jgi:hypothetical protein